MKNSRRGVCLLLCAVLLLSAFSVFASAAEEKLGVEDFHGKRIGVLTGSIQDAMFRELYPDSELCYFSTFGDLIVALRSGAIDCFGDGTVAIESMMQSVPELTHTDEFFDQRSIATAFSKNERGMLLLEQFNAMLAQMEADGSLQALKDQWFSPVHAEQAVDYSDLIGKENSVIFATSCDTPPFNHFYEGNPSGYEVSLIVRFCREYGYGLDIQIADFAGLIPGLTTGAYDIAANTMAVTAERAKSVNFSSDTYVDRVVMAYWKGTSDGSRVIRSFGDVNDPRTRIGVMTGVDYSSILQSCFPQAQIFYFDTYPDALLALKSGKVDAVLQDDPMGRYALAQNPDLALLPELAGEAVRLGMIFQKSEAGEKLLAQFNEYLKAITADGTLEQLQTVWFGKEAATQSISVPSSGENGTVRLATYCGAPPFASLRDGAPTGLDIDLVARFCTAYGYGLEIDDMNFSALINAVDSGRNEIGACGITITPERAEQVNFSDPYVNAACSVMVQAETVQEAPDFGSQLRASFERTFLKEGRWKLIVQGIGMTVLITVLAALFGTLLGFGLCLLRRLKNPVVYGFTTVYIRIMQGTPLLVLLMLLYYVVFNKTGLSGAVVAVIAFSLNFAAYVCEMFRTGIDSVDIGQTEAALAIGFTRQQAFFRIVLPQAARHFLPVYKGEFISLMKSTSIVGYIAVQDLTKMGDIIRSRTYEAFFPLIAVAAIYFVLSALLTSLLRSIELRTEPNRKERTVKGVEQV